MWAIFLVDQWVSLCVGMIKFILDFLLQSRQSHTLNGLQVNYRCGFCVRGGFSLTFLYKIKERVMNMQRLAIR